MRSRAPVQKRSRTRYRIPNHDPSERRKSCNKHLLARYSCPKKAGVSRLKPCCPRLTDPQITSECPIPILHSGDCDVDLHLIWRSAVPRSRVFAKWLSFPRRRGTGAQGGTGKGRILTLDISRLRALHHSMLRVLFPRMAMVTAMDSRGMQSGNLSAHSIAQMPPALR
jgi:hypothetical protein